MLLSVFLRSSPQHQSFSVYRLPSLLQADNQVDSVRQHFYEVSLEYVFKVQEVQERKMFDFVEPVSAFFNPVSHIAATSICLVSLFLSLISLLLPFVVPPAVGVSPGPVHLLSPRLRAGKGLQPLQDWADHQHPECNDSLTYARAHVTKVKRWFFIIISDAILILCSLCLGRMIYLIFEEELRSLRNNSVKATHFVCTLCARALVCCWTGASQSNGSQAGAHLSSSRPRK